MLTYPKTSLAEVGGESGYYPPQLVAEEPPSKLMEYAHDILRGWPILLLAALLALGLTLVARSILPTKYSSRTVLEVRLPNERFLNREAFDPRSTNSVVGADTYLQTQLQIFESDQLLRNVLARMTKEPAGATMVARQLKMTESQLRESPTQAVDALGDLVKAKVMPQTRLIEVVTTSMNPRFSADLGNAIAAEFQEEDVLAQRATLDETSKTMARELEGVKRKLMASQEALQSYLRGTGLLVGGRGGAENMQEGRLAQTQSELTGAQADRIRAQSRFEQINQGNAESLPDLVSDTTLKDYRNQLATLRRELADLSSTLAPKHYRIVKARAQIEQVEKEMAAYEQTILGKIRNEFVSASRREALLQGAYQESASELANQTSKSFRYAQLRGEMETTRTIYESMLARLKETEVLSAVGASNIRIVDRAWPAAKSNPPNLVQSGIMGLGAGLLLGALIAIGRRKPNNLMRDAADVSNYLGVSPLHISTTSQAPITKEGTADLNGWSPAALESYAAVLAGIESNPEAIRMRLSETEWSKPGTGCFVVTSPGRNDGKTVATVGLGVALARNGKSVLLVNADLFHPKLQAIFGVQNEEGIADLLVDGDISNALDLVQTTTMGGLSVLPSGPTVGETLQLFDAPALPHLLQKLRRNFDVVLIDTPPLMQSADARLLAKHADGVILVVRPNHTDRAEAIAARKRLANFGLHITGVILNACRPAPNRYRIRIRRSA